MYEEHLTEAELKKSEEITRAFRKYDFKRWYIEQTVRDSEKRLSMIDELVRKYNDQIFDIIDKYSSYPVRNH